MQGLPLLTSGLMVMRSLKSIILFLCGRHLFVLFERVLYQPPKLLNMQSVMSFLHALFNK